MMAVLPYLTPCTSFAEFFSAVRLARVFVMFADLIATGNQISKHHGIL